MIMDDKGLLEYHKKKQFYLEEKVEEYQKLLKEYQRNRYKNAKIITEIEEKLKEELK